MSIGTEFKRHIRNGSRRPAGVKEDSVVHAKGGDQEIIQRADRVDWRNVSSWAYTDKPATPIVDYAHCDGECD
jgi:hypothetical protein